VFRALETALEALSPRATRARIGDLHMNVRQRYRAGRRRAAVALGAALVLVLAMASPVRANLAGSTFEGNDGNLVVNTSGNHDWVNAPNRVRGDDLATGNSDNAFGQGTKEDDPSVSVVSGSIPPQKSDLTRFYIASEFTSNSNFVYLAWERTNVLGSANMDFEINQKTQPDLTTTGAKTLNRTAGDILITFDFTNGGGNPVLGLLKWVTSGSTSQCFSANSLPCWGNRVDLSAAGFAEGAVNAGTVTDPIAGVSLPGLTFGEAAVNLTAAGVFPPGTCEAFGSAFLKSRSSASFPAEVKDFVAPQPVNISNCGTIVVKKVTIPSPDPTNTAFAFTLTGGPSSLNKSFSLHNGESNTTSNLLAGSGYAAAETVPANWVLVSATCDNGSPVTNISVSPNEVVTCTFTNKLNLGAIQVTKTRKHAADGAGDHPQSGVSFTVNGVTKQTDAAGVACFDGLQFGSYTVHETVPAGYVVDANDKSVTVDNTASCSDNPFVGETVSFHNTPLTDLTTSVTSQVPGGTSSTIVCTDANGNTVASGSSTATAPNLLPGTYTCTVVIDP
jgi:Prealbumin-like fold domain